MTLENYLHRKFNSKKTIASYLFSIKHFTHKNTNHLEADFTTVADYFYFLKEQNLSCAYRIKTLSAIKQYYNYLYDSRQRNDHPCSRFQIMDQTLNGIHFDELFKMEEMEELLNRKVRYAILESKNKIIISLLIYQALTGEEISRIKLTDLDLDLGLLNIKPTPKLNGRTMELHRTQFLLFLNYINEIRPKLLKYPHEYLILTKNGHPETADNIHATVHSMQSMIPDKPLNPRQIRQSVIYHWLNTEKISLADVQIMAGHKWPSSTEKYIRSDHSEQCRIIDAIHPMDRMNLKF